MTLAQKEKRLNEHISSENAALVLAKYQYLADENVYKNHCTPTVLSKSVSAGKVGSLLRKIDKRVFRDLTKGYILETI